MIEVEKEERQNLQARIKEERERLQLEAEAKKEADKKKAI